jgi:hypothetical protein
MIAIDSPFNGADRMIDVVVSPHLQSQIRLLPVKLFFCDRAVFALI